jgi:teichuronic acid biosynthesis glycosyltransferase TuaC
MYPNKVNPAGQVFVQQLAWAFANMGIKCTIICPVAINLNPSLVRLPYEVTETTADGSTLKIFFPKFISMGQQNILGLKTARLTTFLYHIAVKNVWFNLKDKPAVVYGHFLTPSGISASRIGREFNIPSFAAYGESHPWSIDNYGKKLMALIL